MSATVNGSELFFESSEMELRPAPEVFASALLHVAASNGGRLVLDHAPDPVWSRNVAGILTVWNRWWGTATDLSSVIVAPTARHQAPPVPPPPGAGLCFSLGVDSFYSLLRAGHEVDHLILAHGFDIPLEDHDRIAAATRSLYEVARRSGAEPVVIRTNLREHPACANMRWAWAHGGALAALGHAAGERIGELMVSSTKPYGAERPWGSHWETDPGWSSARLRVTHFGAERRKNDKLAEMESDPLVREHLRVCWENRTPAGNCGECDKCVRTMLILDSHGRLADFPVFPQDRPLRERVDGVRRIRRPDSIPVYHALLERTTDEELRDAIERLLKRSAAPAAPTTGG